MGWVKIRFLGRGAFGDVFLAQSEEELLASRRREDVPFVALKCANEANSPSLMREEQIYSILGESKYIVKLILLSWGFDAYGRRELRLALEYASRGTLQNRLQGRLQEPLASSYTRMLLKGLRHVHSKGYVHCDLKPDNILVFPSENDAQNICLKLADFGRAKRRWEASELRLRGTVEYSSPEAVTNGEHEVATDIWALGCIVYRMLHGHGIWARIAGQNALLYAIAQFQGVSLRFDPTLSENAHHFMRQCLRTNPRNRWKTEQLLQHPFITEHN